MNANPPMERRAAMLAADGFIAMIADFYGEPVRDFEHSMQLAGALRASVDGYRARLRAGLAALTGLPEAQGLKAAAIGYCMGGQAALELAREGADLVLAGSFHGILETGRPAAPGAVKARLLVCHGDADPLVPRRPLNLFFIPTHRRPT
jgi:dienelactone hydrolase